MNIEELMSIDNSGHFIYISDKEASAYQATKIHAHYFLLKPILNLIKRIKIFSRLAFKIEDYFNGKADKTLKAQADKNKKRSKKDEKDKENCCTPSYLMHGIWHVRKHGSC